MGINQSKTKMQKPSNNQVITANNQALHQKNKVDILISQSIPPSSILPPIIISQQTKILEKKLKSQQLVTISQDVSNSFNYKKIMEQYLSSTIEFNSKIDKKIYSTMIKQKRLIAEIKNFGKSLPCEQTNAIFVVVNQKNLSQMKAIIFGSEGTPYQHGAFIFSIELPVDYPLKPPKVQLLTTGNATIRFNPNLYDSGYVCLSILGTWRGNSSEEWSPASSISKVLISIQSMVMTDQVYYNQPGYDKLLNNSLQPYNRAYQNIVRYGNIKFAMNEMLQNPSIQAKYFEKIIKTHFYLKKQKILNSVRSWIENSNQPATYQKLTQSHNPVLSAKFKKNQNSYKAGLQEELKKLEQNLKNIELKQTLIKIKKQ